MSTASTRPVLCIAMCVAVGAVPATASAHGVAGQRFFPTTFAVDDPFMNDELGAVFHSVAGNGEAGAPRVRTTSVGVGYAKTIVPNVGLELDEEYLWVHTAGEGTGSGFANLGVTLKYQFLTSDAHEAVLSVGVSDEIGGIGSARVGADSFSTIAPSLFFGKGFGDLPEAMTLLRPIAITGVVGPSFPTQRTTGGVEKATTLTWAFTIQYSLMYLQSAVRDVGLGAPLNRVVAVVELPFQTCLDAGCAGQTTWTVNPGVTWIGSFMELGVAAEIPVKPQSGADIGFFTAHVHENVLYGDSTSGAIFKEHPTEFAALTIPAYHAARGRNGPAPRRARLRRG